MSTIDQIINGDLDLYDYLELEATATIATIRKQYRKKALAYHPDKNQDPDSINQFQLLSQIYEILSNETLRRGYDEIRQNRRFKQRQQAQQDDRTKLFKEQLLQAEQKLNSSKVFNAVDNNELETIRQDGIKRRKQLEKTMLNNYKTYVSYKDIPIDTIFNITDNSEQSTKVIIKWKTKPELKTKLTIEVISEIMSVFGPIEWIKEYPSDDKYQAAMIQYLNYENVDRALQHDYRSSASLWDGTPYRKLASLLRQCTLYQPTSDGLDLNPHFKDYQRNSGIKGDIFTDNDIINDVLIKMINEEMSNSYLT